MTVAAAEAAVGLAIIIALFRHRQTVDLRTSTCSKADAPPGSRNGGCAPAQRHGGAVAVAAPAAAAARLRDQRAALAHRARITLGPADPSAAHGDDHGAHATHAHDEHGRRRPRRRPSRGRAPPLRGARRASSARRAARSSFVLAARDLPRDARRGRACTRRSSRRYFAWMPVGDLQIDAAFQLDQLSMVMMLVITGVGTLIHLFSVGYMQDDPGYPRYFAYLNLFVFFMLLLVLGAQLPAAVHRLGRRRPLLVPADRLLVQREGERRRGQEGVHRQPHRRLRLPDRDVPAVREPRHARLRGRRARQRRRCRSAARSSRRSACSCSSAAPARARRSRSTSGCPTRWPARRRSPRSSTRRRW